MASQFGQFSASELYCPKCARSQPVRERLLLILPDGELYDYLCARCATSLGQRKVTGPAIAAVSTRPAPRHQRPAAPPGQTAWKPPRGLLG